jgi:outer membrane protein assembly factor BamB
MCRKSIVAASLAWLIGGAGLLGGCKSSSSTDSRDAKTSTFKKKWEFTLGSRSQGALALANDGTLIAACDDGFVYAIDSNGKLAWKTYIGPTAASPSIGSDGAIYIANNNGAVIALNRSGSQRWRSVVYNGNTYGHNAAAIGRGILFTPSRDGLKAVSLSDGRLEWSTGLGTEQWGAVTVLSDGTILFGGHGRLYAVDTMGNQLWQYPPLPDDALKRNGGFPPPGQFPVASGITPGPDRLLLVGMGRDHLSAVGQDATLHWDYKSRGNSLNTASPLVATDGTIFFAHADGHLYAFDSFGSQKWSLDLNGYDAATPILAADGTIFALGGRNLYAVSPAGNILAQVDVGNTVTSSPTLAPDGTVYVVNEAGLLSAYEGGHGALMNSPWPKFQGDLANTGVEHSH